MKLLIFAPWIKSKGGAERVILRILELFPKSKLVTYYYDKERTFSEFSKYNVEQIGKINSKIPIIRGFLVSLYTFFKKIDTKNYDLLLISTSGIAELAALRANGKIIAFVHTPFRLVHNFYDYYRKSSIIYRIFLPLYARVYKYFEKKAFSKIEKIIVISEEVKRRLIDYNLATEEKIVKIPPLVQFKFNNSNNDKGYILYISRITRYKRQDLAIKAFLKSKASKKYNLIIAGYPEDKAYLEDLKKLSEGKENIKIITNLGDKEVVELYKNAHATIFLAKEEDTGLVPLESMAFGKPVIAVNEGGPREFIKDGINGLLVNADEKEIARAIDKICFDKKLYSNLKSNIIKNKGYIHDFDSALKKAIESSINSKSLK
ncbi:MAG: glycosyltransferase [Candidatus Rehaiarchaeum fermentans]|nr:glycosyltransferase [Candidatus Rehaiarchaeum fermentans]